MACALAVACSWTPGAARAALLRSDNTPFAPSSEITGALWTSRPYAQRDGTWGDVWATVWADDGSLYTMVDDGGTQTPVAWGVWKQSLARITGAPPRLRFTHVGSRFTPRPYTWPEIHLDPHLWGGPLGAYYSDGLLASDHVLYATQTNDWNWHVDGRFAGLHGIAYSTDHGNHWTAVNKPFPAPLGNLNWVISGRDGARHDAYVYAIASEREYNANGIIIGRSPAGIAGITNPARWQWLASLTPFNQQMVPSWSDSPARAIPIVSWPAHITYPQMTYDAPLHRYLLAFTHSYASATPEVFRNGAELVLLEGPHPWGPFSFVARERNFGPSNGYDPGFPINWVSRDGRDLWLKWSANWNGCAAGLDCSAIYGFNYRRLHLTVASALRFTPRNFHNDTTRASGPA